MEHFLLKKSFNVFDEFSQAIQAWDLDFKQLDRGNCQIELLQVAQGNSLLGHGRFNRRLEQHGSAPLGDWTFGIFAEQSSPLVWHDKRIFNSTMVVYKPGSEIDCVSQPGFEVFTLSYPEDHLNRISANLGLPEIKKLVNESDNFECSLLELSRNRNYLHQLVDVIKRGNSPTDHIPFMHTLDIELSEQILLMLAKSRPAKNSSAGLRNRAIKLTKEYLAQFPCETVAVSQLCKIARVSERTLQYAFLEHYGVTPKTYLKNFRLNNVRKELWQSDSVTTRVNDVASLWGFWHMGQFAADYQKLFGELPSKTLNRRKENA